MTYFPAPDRRFAISHAPLPRVLHGSIHDAMVGADTISIMVVGSGFVGSDPWVCVMVPTGMTEWWPYAEFLNAVGSFPSL